MTEISESATPEDMFARLNNCRHPVALRSGGLAINVPLCNGHTCGFTQLQRVQNVVRMGHVERIHANASS